MTRFCSTPPTVANEVSDVEIANAMSHRGLAATVLKAAEVYPGALADDHVAANDGTL